MELNRALPPEIHPPKLRDLPEMRLVELSNGTRLHIYDSCDQDVNMMIATRGGGCGEAPQAAVAEMAANVGREGTRSFDSGTIALTLDNNGSMLAASASSHHTATTMASLNSRMEHVVATFAEIVCTPTYPDSQVDILRQVLAKNVEVKCASVGWNASTQSDILAMGADHPLARTPLPADFMNVSGENLRQFHDRFNRPDNLDIFMAGRITPKIENIVAKQFESIRGNDNADGRVDIHSFNPAPAGTTKFVEHPDVLQSAISIIIPSIPRTHPDYPILHVTVHALGGYFGSRLMMNIREEKGYTYGVSAGLYGYSDGAFIRIQLECANQYVEDSLRQIALEAKRLADPSTMTDDEIFQIRQSASSSLMEILDSPFSIAQYFNTILCTGIPVDSFRHRQEAIASINAEKIAAMAAKYIRPEDFRTVIVGPKK